MKEQPQHEVRHFDVAELRAIDDETPRLTGYAAVFEARSPVMVSRKLGKFVEAIKPGAFQTTLNSNEDVRALYEHDTKMLLGRRSAGTLRLNEDERGLQVEIDIPDTTAGRDAYALVQRGDIRGMSFGFLVRPNGEQVTREGGMVLRSLTDLLLLEVTITSIPVFDQTSIESRSIEPNISPAALEELRRSDPDAIARAETIRRLTAM